MIQQSELVHQRGRPHKLSATIEAVDETEQLLGSASSPPIGPATQRCGPSRICGPTGLGGRRHGAGRPPPHRLLGDRERVGDVPPELATWVRLFDSGHDRKAEAHDAHAVAAVVVRTKPLRVLQLDGELKAPRMLVDWRQLRNATSSPDRRLASRRCCLTFFQRRRTRHHHQQAFRRAEQATGSTAGNRRMNHVIHIAASQLDPPRHPRARLLPAQASRRHQTFEAIRCLKRRISEAIYPVADRCPRCNNGSGRAPRGESPGVV